MDISVEWWECILLIIRKSRLESHTPFFCLLSQNTTTKENETLLAVGTAYVQGEDVAARGRVLLFSLGRNADNLQNLVLLDYMFISTLSFHFHSCFTSGREFIVFTTIFV